MSEKTKEELEIELLKTQNELLRLKNQANQNNSNENDLSSKTAKNEKEETLHGINKIKKLFKTEITLTILVIVSSILFFFMAFIPNQSILSIIVILMSLLISGCAIALFVVNIVTGVKILTTDFKNKEINENKIIWGVLTLVLGWIFTLVFIITAKNKIEE